MIVVWLFLRIPGRERCLFVCLFGFFLGGSVFSFFFCFVFLVSRDCCVALPHHTPGLSAVCDCGISGSFSLSIFAVHMNNLFPSISVLFFFFFFFCFFFF